MRRKILSIAAGVALVLAPATLHHAHAYSGMIVFENAQEDKAGPKHTDCATQRKSYADMDSYGNTYIPGTITPDAIAALDSSAGGTAVGSIAGRAVGYTAFAAITGAAAIASGPAGLVLLAIMALTFLVEGKVVEDVCNNVYIMNPHEWLNIELNKIPQNNTSSQSGKNMGCTYDAVGQTWANNAPGALTQTDVPYFYTCDPNLNTTSGTQVNPGDTNANMIGSFWGYAGSGSTYCNNSAVTTTVLDKMKDKIGGIVLVDTGNEAYRSFNARTRCNPQADGVTPVVMKAGTSYMMRGTIELNAYYKFDTSEGKTYICVAAPRLITPVRIGCSFVAPPTETPQLDRDLLDYISGTRCEYFLYGRKDLRGLGESLSETDEASHTGVPVKGFLKSDMHLTSTTVGCIKDMLIRVFISPVSMEGTQQIPFFGRVQNNLRQIVFAVLVLYVTLIGIKIMSAAQQPSRGDYIMFVVKFALVVYFTTAGAWYSINGNQVSGLLPAIMGAAEEFGDIFLQAQNTNDPVGFCNYKYNGKQILSQGTFPIPAGGEGTAGLPYVQMTIWDLIDCKVINYVNMGSCSYTLTGLFSVWFIGSAFWAGGSGFIFSIVCFIYTLMLMFIIFRFAHIYIMSLFVLAVLTLISPIILCFALFEATKQIFQTWIKMILGYMLYPALLMAFVALMLATFDAAFYGTILQPGETISINTDPCAQTLQNAAGETTVAGQRINDSARCVTYRNYMNKAGVEPCSISPSSLSANMLEEVDWKIIKFHVMKREYIDLYMKSMLKLMLFAILFYFFLGSVAQFLEILVGVQSLSGLAIGGMSALSPIVKGGQAAGWVGGKVSGAIKGAEKDAAESKAKKAAKSLADKDDD
ncbi:MAG: type IV secretion system protein [Proteobacteria bacterium]|nr:type IV secretion system protein [Pseudomonadota bacterium]